MKGFFSWFKDGAKMKRWMMLILVGVIFASFGMANLIKQDEAITFTHAAKVIAFFVVGFTFVVLGLVFINKRTMELFIEATDERIDGENKVNVKSLIFNKKIYDGGPNIVVLGGGSGLNTILEGLKKYTSNVTAIVTVSDYGESFGKEGEKIKYLQLEDIKNGIASLAASEESKMKDLLNYKFSQGVLKGVSFSDLYFEAMTDISKGTAEAVKNSNDIFKIYGEVLPVTEDKMKICAEMENGYVVEEKSQIANVAHNKLTKINRIYLNPTNCKPTKGVIAAIQNADCIIIGPGSLYTNVIPNLLVNNVTKAIRDSKAEKIYVCNIMTEPGQTDNYTVADHVNAIIDHCGENIINYCLYDTGEVIPEFIKKYNMDGADLVEQDTSNVKDKKIKFMKKNLSIIKDDAVRHDATIIANTAIQLICDDLKYLDKQNEPEYMMMNTKLLADKRMKKQKKRKMKQKPEGENKKEKQKSKFASKYSDRINSIKESDQKTEERKRKMKQEMMRERRRREEKVLKEKMKELKEERTQRVRQATQRVEAKVAEERKESARAKITDRDIRPKDYDKIRKEMIEKFNNSKLKD